ncbi:MAG: DUF2283 domain-containing protein [Nanobdellota archaeon]
MKEFKFDYDKENDSLFVYSDGPKSNGAIEIGNFVFDFDKKGDLKAMEILDASEILKNMLFKAIELSKIREFRADIINFRNMASIQFCISDDVHSERSSFIIPREIEKSPVLKY